ncbi:hypothetical protein TM7_0285 [candidate division TM7 genomosp. GTL1]|nr:hypothetical protein TM7_0285 [candidate division TM7 genomosp. GTL1]
MGSPRCAGHGYGRVFTVHGQGIEALRHSKHECEGKLYLLSHNHAAVMVDETKILTYHEKLTTVREKISHGYRDVVYQDEVKVEADLPEGIEVPFIYVEPASGVGQTIKEPFAHSNEHDFTPQRPFHVFALRACVEMKELPLGTNKPGQQ